MELHELRNAGGLAFSCLLKTDNGVDKLRASPRIGDPLRLPQRNDIGSGFFYYAVAVHFQLSKDRRLARSRGARQNVFLHICLLAGSCLKSFLITNLVGQSVSRMVGKSEVMLQLAVFCWPSNSERLSLR
jgi:hypothetical protein